MDLQAYLNIESLEGLAKNNHIGVPRLRGYYYMANEKRRTKEEIESLKSDMLKTVYEDGCTSIPRFHPDSYMYELSQITDAVKKKYLDGNGVLRWDLLHGKRRKRMRFAVKKKNKAVEKECDAWNRYAGRDDVLCVRARIGGLNWYNFGGARIEKEPWFIEKVDDCFDDTYCYIYAKVKV